MDKKQRLFSILSEVEEKYCGKTILDIDVLGFKYTSKSMQQLELGLATNSLTPDQYKDIDYTKAVTLKEWFFALLSSCPDLVEFEDEIDSLFVKRMGNISTELIYNHKEWNLYIQTGQHLSAAIKLSCVLQHDICGEIVTDLSKVLEYHISLSSEGCLDLSMFNVKWESDVLNLAKRINKEFDKKRLISNTTFTQQLAFEAIFDLIKFKKTDSNSTLYNHIFFFGFSDLLKEITAHFNNIDIDKYGEYADKYFKSEDFARNLVYKDSELVEYMEESDNYIKRIIKKGNLDEFGTYDSAAFYPGAAINPYLPKRQGRSDYQFILYYIANQAINAYNKTLKGHIDSEEHECAKENMLKAYLLGKQFNLEGKELHNFGITLNMIFTFIEEIHRMANVHLHEVVEQVTVLKTTYSKLSDLLEDRNNEILELKAKLKDEADSRETILLDEKSKIQKSVYDNLKDEFNSTLTSYKKENEALKKNLEQASITQEEEFITTIELNDIQEPPTVKNITSSNVLIIGDYNLKVDLFNSIFNSVKKIDGNNAANINIDSALAGIDIVALQYTFSQHDSLRIVKAAKKRNIQVVFFESVNERRVLDEIYGGLYK